MKKLLLPLIFLIFNSSLFAQSWDWGSDGTGLKTDANSVSVTTDMKGNAYVAGIYQAGITFGSFFVETVSDYGSFIGKFNSAGAVKWLTQPIGSVRNVCYAASVTTDLNGNIFLTGIFSDTEKFGTFKLVNPYHSNQDIFLAKYDSNGNVIWATQAIPNTSGNYGVNSVATDKIGNSYITGWFWDTVQFGAFILPGSYSNPNVFLAKYDANGNIVWARQSIIPNLYCQASANSVCTDRVGNVYVTGVFSDSAKFGAYWLTNPEGTFIVKYDSNGNVLKAITPIGNSGAVGNSITTDKLDNVYVTGTFSDSITFGLTTLRTGPSSTEVFYVKYDTSGKAIWARQSSSVASYWEGLSIFTDSANNIYLGGNNNNGVATPITFGSYTLTPKRGYAAFILKCNNIGDPICGSLVDNGVWNGVNSQIAVDYSGKYSYLSATQIDTIFYGPSFLVAASLPRDPYLLRWQPCNASNNEEVNNLQSSNDGVVLYPNPNNGKFTIQLADSYKLMSKGSVEFYNMLGEKVYSKTVSTINSPLSIDLSSQSCGVYLYRVVNENGNLAGEGKFIIQR